MWQSDNTIFNVNGIGIERLKLALKLAFYNKTICGWKFNKNKGIILHYYDLENDVNKFPVPLEPEQVAEIVFNWLSSDQAKEVSFEEWEDSNQQHDGSNKLGWRAYTEKWGDIDGEMDVLAIKPAYLWFGK